GRRLERICHVDHDLAREVARTGLFYSVLRAIPAGAQQHDLAKLRRICVRLLRVAVAQLHLVAVLSKARGERLADLSSAQDADFHRLRCSADAITSSENLDMVPLVSGNH